MKSFFVQERNCCWKTEESEGKETEFKKKGIKKIKGQTEKEMKEEVKAKRDEQKQKVTKKGWKNLSQENHKNIERDSF